MDHSITDNKSNNTSSKDEVRLIAPEIKNELYQLNTAFFKTHHPDIYQKIQAHQCARFRICLNPDDSMNIYNIKKKSVIYPLNAKECEHYFSVLLASLKLTFKPYTIYLEDNELSQALKRDLPLNARFHSDLLNTGTLLKHIDPNTKQHNISKEQINFLPLLRVYGLGLGYHLTQALKQYDVACLIINEPEFDLFYTSLFATPWHELLATFNANPNRHYLFNFNPLKTAIQNESNFLSQLHPYYANAKASLFGMPDRDFNAYITQENAFDNTICYHAAGGCYEDQAKGLANAIHNINSKKRIYNGKKSTINAPVFLIGSGPSFDASIAFIQKNQDKALIIACGSAISALIKHNITPDIHVVQERFVSKDFLLNYTDTTTYAQITCVKLNVVDDDIDTLYRDTFVLQKANDPGSTLLNAQNYPHLYNTTPTVTNTGLVLCRLLNPETTYLFGLDYGSSEEFLLKHSKFTTTLEAHDYLDKEKQMVIDGYHGKKVYSNEYFIASRDVAELEIKQAKQIQWINVGSGAIIQGSIQKDTAQLAALKTNLDKNKLLKQLNAIFDNNYQHEAAHQKLHKTDIPEATRYLVSLLECFDTIPASRTAMMTTIGLITQASKVGSDEQNYLPTTLFSLEFANFFNNIYVQIAATSSDEEATHLYKNAVTILKKHINLVFEHFLSITTTLKHTQ